MGADLLRSTVAPHPAQYQFGSLSTGCSITTVVYHWNMVCKPLLRTRERGVTNHIHQAAPLHSSGGALTDHYTCLIVGINVVVQAKVCGHPVSQHAMIGVPRGKL